MTRKRDRLFILIGTAIFFLSSIALSVAVVIQMWKDDHKSTDKKAATNTSQTSQKEGNKVDDKNKLQGKPLKDFTPNSEVSELQKIDLQEGNGTEVKAGDTVTVDYTGAVAATGVVFQSSLDSGQPVTFGLDQVIDGWKEGIPGMKAGGKRRLIIPADKAYGANPPQGSGIPANAPLVFDVTLHGVGQ
jgi:FKBP-type peptidyl-prolyl cis-trans isomerase